MDPLLIIVALLLGAAVLVAAEMLLPTGGVLGVAAAVAACGAVAVAFSMNRWVGVGMSLGLAVVAPVVVMALMKAWERSPAGKRIMLNAITPPLEHERILPGDLGTTISELRPMGEAEFGPISVQVVAHRGSIAANTPVRVLSYKDGVATVETVTA